jgi:hypothetical protein
MELLLTFVVVLVAAAIGAPLGLLLAEWRGWLGW